MNQTRFLLDKFKPVPFGLKLFSKGICLKAPYFGSIAPEFTHLESGYGIARLKKRWALTNHIGTVHAIAMANLCEFVGGVTLEVSLPETHRWIPKGMTIRYLQKAKTDLTAETHFPLDRWPDSGSFVVHVDVKDEKGQIVCDADIDMQVGLKH